MEALPLWIDKHGVADFDVDVGIAAQGIDGADFLAVTAASGIQEAERDPAVEFGRECR
jgi:2-hydroxychromene-2-carboxylate isomerase